MAEALANLADFAAVLNGQGPLGVAVSGGGDSLALLYALQAWGRRPLHVLHVDHRIHPDSGTWAQDVIRHAAQLGLPVTVLSWHGDKPPTGLSAAARQARHALLAQAARDLGIHVLCLAHTADDVAEATAMRAQGSNVGTPRLWSPSPVWPQGRGVYLCRPLLHQRRADLRDALRTAGATWIDDPANDSVHSLRARVRKALGGAQILEIPPDDRPDRQQVAALLHDSEGWSALGLLRLRRDGLISLPRPLALRLLAMAAVCAGGGDRLPRRHAVDALYDRLNTGGVHTLAGSRLWQSEGLIHISREPGDMTRRPPSESPGAIWDGRFELSQALSVMPTARVRQALGDTDQAFVKALPAVLRATLPVLCREGPHLALPSYGVGGQKHFDTVTAVCWVLPRFLASACRIETETDLTA